MSEDISYNQYNINYYLPQRIGPGALGNNQVEMCKVCSQNGYPHEAIVYRAQRILNYHTGARHVHKQTVDIHKQLVDDPRAWAALWSVT